MSSDWTRPFEPDEHTVALYHFDEGSGDEAHDACGDPDLTLRSSGRALWGSRPGFGSTARFERSDSNIRVGPANNDKLQLRTCSEGWTIEAWVRYTGPGGRDRVEWGRFDEDDALLGRYTYAFLCGTDEEGFSLPSGMRGGWSFYLNCSGVPGTREDGLMPGSRLLGWSGRMPIHGILITPTTSFGWLEEDRGRFRDTGWHHVAWQFRYRDQMNCLLVDGKIVRQVQLPIPGQSSNRILINDADRCDIPFYVGGLPHSRDPVVVTGLEFGNMDGEIDELRISSVMRYPVTDRMAVIRDKLPEAGLRIPYEVRLGADAAAGRVSWEMTEGSLPAGLAFDTDTGVIRGTPGGNGGVPPGDHRGAGRRRSDRRPHVFAHGAARPAGHRVPANRLRGRGLSGRAEHGAHGRTAGVERVGRLPRRHELRPRGRVLVGDSGRGGMLPDCGPGDGRERVERSR